MVQCEFVFIVKELFWEIIELTFWAAQSPKQFLTTENSTFYFPDDPVAINEASVEMRQFQKTYLLQAQKLLFQILKLSKIVKCGRTGQNSLIIKNKICQMKYAS